MKRKATFAVLILAACGGNYSNEDVEFIGALPLRRDLESKLPQQAVGAAGTRQDALSLGEPSTAYRDARAASDGFNGALFWLLDLVDQIRSLPPSRREPDRRFWGPFPDNDHPDFLSQVVMERREQGVFTYRIEVKRKDAPASAPWTPFILGSFRSTGGARKGIGEVHLLGASAAASGFGAGTDLEKFQSIDMSYVTDRSPTEVDMSLRVTPDAGVQSVDYAYSEYDDHHGSIRFSATAADQSGNQLVLAVTARWLPSGEGRSDITVQAGTFLGTLAVECWDAQFRVTYADKPWENPQTVGSPGNCAL